MITNKVLDKAITIGGLWIYARLMSRLERSLQLKVVKYTPLFSFPRRETIYSQCNSGFEFSAALLTWLKVCKTPNEFQRHKWLLGCSKFLLLAPLSSLRRHVLGSKAGFHSTCLKLPQVPQHPRGSLSSSQLQHLLAAPRTVLQLHHDLGLGSSPVKRKEP